MTNRLRNVLAQALTTFTCKPEKFSANLRVLASLMDKITAEDVNLPQEFFVDHFWKQPGKAPVTCIDIYGDSILTMGIFVLKPQGRLPLHNHPKMYGLIKVIAGKIRIISYSLNTEQTKEIDERGLNESHSTRRSGNTMVITAELNEEIIADKNSPPCILEPDHKNLHEIESIDGAAAFLDILSPPYEAYTSSNTERQCHYYAPLSQAAPNVFKLHEIRSPSWYWTDSCPYTGPSLDDIVK